MSERKDGRENMGRMIEHLRGQGVSTEKATDIARNAQIRKDARESGDKAGSRRPY